MATIDLMDQFSHLGKGGIRNNGTLDAEVMFQTPLRTMRTDFIQVKAGDSIVYKNMNGMSSSWNILSFYTGEAQGYYASGIAGQTTPQSGVWTAAQDGYVRLFGSFPAGDNISVTMTDLAPDVEDYLAQYNAMNYRFLPNSIPKIVAHIQEYLVDHPIADSTTLQAVIDAAFESYMEEIQETADDYISEAVPQAAAAAVDAAAAPALEEINAKTAEAAESARQAGLSQQSAEMSEENALTYQNQAQQIKDSITAEVSASVLAAQEQATLAQESAQAADESADTAEQYVSQARVQAEAAADHAQTASGYASDAQGYMQDASGFAQNASDFADNAAQSAATFTTDPTLTIAGKAADAKATGDQLSDLKSEFDNLQGGVISGLQNMSVGDLIANRYITPAGNMANYNGWSATYYIDVPVGVKIINVTASSSSGGNYNAFYDSEKTFISNFAYQAGKNGIAVPDNAAYVRLSGTTSVMNTIALTFATLAAQKLDTGFYSLNDVIKNSDPGRIAIGAVGDVIDYTPTYNANMLYGIFPVVQGDVFKITGVGGSIPRLWCFVDENDVVVSRSSADLSVTDLVLVAPTNGKLIINTNFRNYNIRKQLNDGGIAYSEAVNKANYDYRNNGLDILSAFNNVTCCGDSLTASVVYTHDNGDGTHQTRSAYKKYPWILGQKIGAEAESVATGGYTATDWWGAYASRIVQKENHLIIIYLGTNGGLTDTLATDAPGTDYTQYANTNTGNYCKMVAKSLEVGARVLLIKIHHGGGGDTFVTNSVVDQIAEKFNVAVVNVPELQERKYHAFPDNTGINDLHYNDLGYAAFAEALIRNVGALPDNMMVRLIPQ